MREIVFDTETTGTNAKHDRIVEIAGVELIDLIPTGNSYHAYVNPGIPVSPGAFRVHGLSNEFLRGHPPFRRVVKGFLAFVGDARMVAHNAKFDRGFLEEEMSRIDMPPMGNEFVDTLELAKKVKRGGQHNLDALCRHFGIDNSRRTKHGALLDSEILAEVYLHLNGGRQFGMELVETSLDKVTASGDYGTRAFTVRSHPDELAAHAAFVEGLGAKAIWNKYVEEV